LSDKFGEGDGVRKSRIELLVFAMALTLSANVFAVGMGGINVGSGLGQQLKADIELMAVSKAEKASLVARLASPEAYKDAGLEYPYGNKFKFQIESRANGEPYLKVSSEQPINDPFVIMLVELSWSSGKLLREYTFLLDPPGFAPEQPAQAAVQAVAPSVQSAPAVTPVTPEGQAAPSEQPAQTTPISPVGQTSPVETAPASSSVPASAPAVQAVPARQTATLAAEPLPELDEWIVIKRGDTMREIADQYKLVDMSLDRMLVALYRANKNLFDGRNMNRIKAGKILRLPHQSEVEAVSQSDAVREIRAQAADWNVYRQKLASAAVIRKQPQEAQQIATGKISSSVADMAPPVKESAKEVLKLSKGEAPGDKTAAGAGGKTESAQDRKNAEQEEAIAKGKALKEEQARVAMLEKQIKELQRLSELKSGLPVKTEAAALAKSTKAADAPVAAASGAAAASAEKPKPKPQPKPQQKAAEPESLMDQILAEPLYLAGGAILLLGLGGLGFVLIRRKKKPHHEGDIGEPSGEAGSETVQANKTGRITAPVVPSPDTGDFTRMGATEDVTPQADNNIDPIGEADLFLNFGRDAQAEEILKEALQSTPNDHRIHLKLLGIYANRVDTTSFAGIAQQLKDSGDDSAWQQALAMGRKLEPNNTLYGGSGASMESTVSATTGFDATQMFTQENVSAAPVLDFDIDLGSSSAKGATSPEQDFLGNADQNAIMSFDVLAAGQAPEMDFNVAAGLGGGGHAEPALPDNGDMIFDVGSSFMPAPAPEPQPEAAKPVESGDGGMEFTLDFPIESQAAKAAPEVQPAGVGLAGISLNFDETVVAGEPTPAGKDEHWQEIATKLDLAKAYQEMGDAGGAREILEEVMRDGDAGQREAAQALINQLG
jgi:pilus assembly protein FimV